MATFFFLGSGGKKSKAVLPQRLWVESFLPLPSTWLWQAVAECSWLCLLSLDIV